MQSSHLKLLRAAEHAQRGPGYYRWNGKNIWYTEWRNHHLGNFCVVLLTLKLMSVDVYRFMRNREYDRVAEAKRKTYFK